MNNPFITIEELFTDDILVKKTDYPAYDKRCTHHLFEQQVTKTPNQVAVIFGSKTLTYNELNIKANRLAAYLLKSGNINTDKPVGIMLQRSELMIIGILGIMKAGGAYVPIDPENPADYTNYICNDCEIGTILTENIPGDRTLFNLINFINLNDTNTYIGDGRNIIKEVGSHNLAYIIYTSGSTGRPKGVMIEHRSIINKLNWMNQQYPLKGGDTVLQKSNFVFDVSVWELLWPLLSGARLCFLQPGAQIYPEKIVSTIMQSGVTIVHFVPAMLQLFLNHLELNPHELAKLANVKRVYTSGEALTAKQANLFNKLFFKRFGTGLTNQYGPTEAAVEVTYFDCEQSEPLDIVPIGKSIKNTQLYICSDDGRFLPDGDTGELIIAGVQVARGYVNNPALTNAKFIVNPFNRTQKMYKTGDKARIMPDGNIEFLGRIDEQVKINGYRIEPGQIENVIRGNNYINECIVSLRNVEGLNELVAYIAVKSNNVTNDNLINELVAELKIQLPAHMVPAFVVKLDAFPLTSSGKVDRKKLPSPLQRFHQKSAGYVPPENHTQKIIAAIWEEALVVQNIGIDDNFFDLGGRSLIVAKVISLINSKFETKLSYSIMFQLPTIREISNKIDHNHAAPLNPIVLVRPGLGTPLLMFPGVDSATIAFNTFQQNYAGSQPLYSILYPVIDSSFPFTNLQQYAAYVIKQMKMIVPQGPYGLMGYSMGGRLAFEVALQLQQADERVDLLAIISSFPTREVNKSDKFKRIVIEKAKTIAKLNGHLMVNYFTHRVPYLLKKLFKKTEKSYDDVTFIAENQCSNKSHPLYVSAWDNYETKQKFAGDVLLIREDIAYGDFDNYQNFNVYRNYVMGERWKEYVNGNISDYVIKCSHFDFLLGTRVRELADLVNQAWKK